MLSIIKYFAFFCLLFSTTWAQSTLTLNECIRLAQEHSPEAKHAGNTFLEAYYDYKLYKKSFLPALSLSGSLPSFYRTISKLTLPDGKEAFVSQSTGNYTGSLSLTQPIPFMGGEFFVSSGLQRLDVYTGGSTKSYLANLINVGIRQPFVFYNDYKWSRQIEPLQYKEAQKLYAEAIENAAVQAIELYFSLLETQISLQVNMLNKNNADTLLQIAQERYKLGKIAEDELLQVELNRLNLVLQIEELQSDLQDKQTTLTQFMGIADNQLQLTIPTAVGINAINKEIAFGEAIDNGAMELTHRRKLLEAKKELARTKADNGFSVNLFASFGLSQSDESLKKAYASPLDQEQITLSINIPLTHWGIVKYKRQKAEVRLLDLALTVDQEKLNAQRVINTAVNQYNIHATQLAVTQKTVELSAKRYEMTKERYLTGKIGFLDYSVAQNEKDKSQIDYIRTLQKGWSKYYEIRKLTLFDFQTNTKIVNTPNELINKGKTHP